jgi:hypothetical protein
MAEEPMPDKFTGHVHEQISPSNAPMIFSFRRVCRLYLWALVLVSVAHYGSTLIYERIIR